MKTSALLLASSLAFAGCQEQPKHAVWAKVTSVYPFVSRYQPERMVIEFRSGELSGKTTLLAVTNRCRVGDAVHAIAQGVSLTIGPEECRKS